LGNTREWKLIGKHSSLFRLARGIVLGNSKLSLPLTFVAS
jgi:hypothetical protein